METTIGMVSGLAKFGERKYKLLFDIFRIYQDYLDISKELSLININSNIHKLICEEIRYNNVMIVTILNKIIIIEKKLYYIDESKLKKNQK